MDRVVALKLLSPTAMKDESAVKRFQHEVKAAGRLSHPNIVTAFDADEDQGVHFLVMEYVEGSDLSALVVEKGRLPLARAVDYVLQAAKGLDYAHRADVIHRDIKPSNLLVDAKGTVRILDMGLARIQQTVASDGDTVDEGLTRSGDVMGTVDYMSPEQAMNTKDADARADVYSLGATFYYLLTGQPMYSGNSLVERILAHRESLIPSLRSARPDVPESLDHVFQRMVAKKRENRIQSMADVIAALTKCAVPTGGPTATPITTKPALEPTLDFTDLIGIGDNVTLGSRSGDTTAAFRPGESNTTVGARPALGPETAAPKPKRTTPRPSVPPRTPQKPTTRVPLESLWAKAVQEASESRRDRGRLVKILLKVTALVVVLGGVGWGCYAGVHAYQRNAQRLRQSEKTVLEAVNLQLRAMQFDALDSVQFTQGSPYLGVPATLSFESPVSVTSSPGVRRPFGTLKGKFDRTSGVLELDADLLDGTQQRGVKLSLAPVP
jgi:serine/threonine protein kinase